MLFNLPYLQFLAGVLMVVLVIGLALAVRTHARRVKTGESGGHPYSRNSASDLQSGSFSELEEWLIDNRSRLLEFKMKDPSSKSATNASSKKDKHRDWD